MPPARSARLAVSAFFFLNGAVLASWVPHIPAVKARHGIGDGSLGAVLLAMAVGAVTALPLAGGLVARFGSRRMTALAALGLAALLPLPIVSPTVGLVAASLVVFGACNALLDVSMNAQAVIVERMYERAIMSSFHALFSLGGLAGAGIAALAMWSGMRDVPHVVGTALAALAVVALASRTLVAAPAVPAGTTPVFVRPAGVLVGLGVLAFLGLLAEGAMGDWSAVYLRDALRSTPAAAAMGFAAFSLAMATGRLAGDRLVGRFGPGGVLRASGAVAALGLGGALVVGRPEAAIAGCALVGAGIANVVPILFSAAGRVAGVDAGTALAAVATTGYCGLLAGPPLIGLAAEVAGLPAALGLVSVSCGLVAVGARRLA
jgi:MFS family permease